MKIFIRHIYKFILVGTLVFTTSCSDAGKKPDEITDKTSKDDIAIIEQDGYSKIDQEYSKYLEQLNENKSNETYYKIVFAFENLPNGVSSVPIENVKNMYNDLNENYEYISIGINPLIYRGEYKGDTKFIDGFDEHANINITANDWDGNEYLATPLKTIDISENTVKHFDKKINEGRNFKAEDFILKNRDDSISVILGNGYKSIYDLDDEFTMELVTEMNFKVVGFFNEGESFTMENGLIGEIDLDNVIMTPKFIPSYSPVGDAEIYQHSFIMAELTSGYIKVLEDIRNLDYEYHDIFATELEKLATKNGLSGLYVYPNWVVGFIW